MLCLTNYARRRAGLAPLRESPLLDRAGQAKLRADLACSELSHTPCGRPFRTVFASYLAGAEAYVVGENIAWATGELATPRQMMAGWLHSPHHRENILTARFRELGVGYLPGATFLGRAGVTLWAQEFGVRSPTQRPSDGARTALARARGSQPGR